MVCCHALYVIVDYDIAVTLRDPDDETVLIEGVLFRARYLGSTQLISEGNPSKAMRMMQAQEAVGRIKVSCYWRVSPSPSSLSYWQCSACVVNADTSCLILHDGIYV